MSRRIVVVGGGVVGASLAASLIERAGLAVTVLERGPRDRLVGSTGHAPGFVGLLGEAPVATALARASAACYERLEHGGRAGFDRVGGLEVAYPPAAMSDLERRAALADGADLGARVLDPAQAVALAPGLVDPERCVGGVLYPQDGTARAGVITAALKDRRPRRRRVSLRRAGHRHRHPRRPRHRRLHGRADAARRRRGLGLRSLGAGGRRAGRPADALTPVAHPYVYGPPHDTPPPRSPFVRWPEHHVYARDHGDRLGLGTYDHTPLPVAVDQLGTDAEQPWPAEPFDAAVRRALDLLPARRRFTAQRRLNGVFSMTADNLPLLGAVDEVSGLWMAEALWVTHAAGAARSLARLMTGATPGIDGLDALRPGRFDGRRPDELMDRALRLYGYIYATA